MAFFNLLNHVFNDFHADINKFPCNGEPGYHRAGIHQ